MPQMGESIVEGTVTKWLKNIGEPVERDEPLLEISTDKVDAEVPATVAGVLVEILVQEGETVEINTVVGRIGAASTASEQPAAEAAAAESPGPDRSPAADHSGGDDISAPTADAAIPEAPQAAQSPIEDATPIRSSPLVKRLAKEHNIDLRQLQGTGQGGRISKRDIEAYLEARGGARAAAAPSAAPPAETAGPSPTVATVPAELTAAFHAAPQARFGDHRVEPLSTMRKRIAEHMVMTQRVAPQVSTIHQFDVTAVANIREKTKDQFFERHGIKLTYMPFFLKATASALKAFPAGNASLDADQVIYHNNVNIAIAVALDWGLIVPVIKDADKKGTVELQQATTDLANRARNKQLTPEEVREGTFSISNYGSYGSLLATPAINQPQSAILGLGAIHKAPVVINDAIAIRSISYVTLTFDHRLLDGAVADEFLNHMKGVIENWDEAVS